MPNALSYSIKKTIVHLSTISGKSIRTIASELKLHKTTVARVLKQHRETGDVHYRIGNQNAVKLTSSAKVWLLQKAKDCPFESARSLQESLSEQFNCSISIKYIPQLLRKNGILRQVAACKPFLGEMHITQREQFVERYFFSLFLRVEF